MASLEAAFTFTLSHEDSQLSGVVTKDPTKTHPEAVARFGVNSAAHPKALSDGFYTMDRDAALQYAADIFKYEYFAPIGGYQITDQAICNKFSDLAFNVGVKEATLIVQRACNALSLPGEVGLQVDGKPGQKTIDAINKNMPSDLLAKIKYYACDFYRSWAFRTQQADEILNALLIRANS